jgi:hypothetical protein
MNLGSNHRQRHLVGESGRADHGHRARATWLALISLVSFAATILLWFTGIEAETFLALQIAGIAATAIFGLLAARYAALAGHRSLAKIALAAVIALLLASLAVVWLLIEFASRFE